MVATRRLTVAILLVLAVVPVVGLSRLAHGEDQSPEPVSEEPEPKEEPVKKSRWQILFSSANIYPKLEESEERIDRQINNGLGRLFRNWEEPTTFKDWRDNAMLWDLQIGVSYEVTPKANLFVVFGGADGKIPNEEDYWLLGRPIEVKIEFERAEIIAATGIDYYPWGQPELPERKGDENTVWRRLKAAKPYVEGAMGYLSVKERGTTDLERPIRGRIFHYDFETRYDLFFVSPRVGIDIPISKKNSLAYMVGPSFFTTHSDEFNSIGIYTIFRHRF